MVKAAPDHVIASVLGVENLEYAIYIADVREVTDGGLGDPIREDPEQVATTGSHGDVDRKMA